MDLLPLGAAPAHVFPTLRARLTEREAVDAFTGGAARHVIGLIRRDQLRSIAPVYVPYHLFRVEISDRGQQQTVFLAIDAVIGSLDLYHFAPDRAELDLVDVHSRNRIAAAVTADDAWPPVADQLRRFGHRRRIFDHNRNLAPEIEAHRRQRDAADDHQFVVDNHQLAVRLQAGDVLRADDFHVDAGGPLRPEQRDEIRIGQLRVNHAEACARLLDQAGELTARPFRSDNEARRAVRGNRLPIHIPRPPPP